MGPATNNGQPIIVPGEQLTGQQIKERLGIAPDRLLFVMQGEHVRRMEEDDSVTICLTTHFLNSPGFRYGG